MVDFGAILKEWRAIRRMSQLDLALTAEVSSRHISFLETGRARASRDMVLRLGEGLQMPLGVRNQFLLAAGLAPAFGEDNMDESQRAPLLQAVDWMLQRHAPYPAMALDHRWRLSAMNAPARGLLQVTGIELGDSLVEALCDNDVLRAALVNLEEIEALTLMRLRTELAQWGTDELLERVISKLQQRVALHSAPRSEDLPAVIPTTYRLGGQELRLFSTLSHFASTGDVAMSELRVEMMFPADEASRLALTAMFS